MVGGAVRCQWPVRWYHQRWHSSCLRESCAMHSGMSHRFVRAAIRCRSLYSHEIKVKLCQKRLSKQDERVCMWVPSYNRAISSQAAPGSGEIYSFPKPCCENRFTFHLINTNVGAHTTENAHKEEELHIWCLSWGTCVRSWSDINCTQIKMDLAPAVGSVIHSDAAAEDDLSGVKSDASLSHPNTYHIREGGKRNSCIELCRAHRCAGFISLSSNTSLLLEGLRILGCRGEFFLSSWVDNVCSLGIRLKTCSFGF